MFSIAEGSDRSGGAINDIKIYIFIYFKLSDSLDRANDIIDRSQSDSNLFQLKKF